VNNFQKLLLKSPVAKVENLEKTTEDTLVEAADHQCRLDSPLKYMVTQLAARG